MANCYECQIDYGSRAWSEALVPTKFWLLISPTGHDGGLLCFQCMEKKFWDLGYGQNGNKPVPFRIYHPNGSMMSELYSGFDYGLSHERILYEQKKWDSQFWKVGE